MARKDYTNESHGESVDQETAYHHAVLAVRKAAASGVNDFDDWEDAEVREVPLPIEDLNGEPLFYDFEVAGAGVVRCAANTLVGTPVVSMQLGTRIWSQRDAEAKALESAAQRQDEKGSAASLVCYSYPKIGVRVVSGEGDRLSDSAIYDVADGAPVEVFGADELEGLTSYSFLDMASREAGRRLRRWASAEAELEGWREAAPEILEGGPFSVEHVADLIRKHRYAIYIPPYAWNTVRYAPRCDRPEVFQLYAQQTNVYCAVATGQMILDFYKYHFDQDDIATAMNTGPGGTTNSDQVSGYESLSNNGLDATYDTSASWSEAKAEIDANRPVKSGIPGHARAVAGWKRQNFSILGTSPTQWIKVYDPWPWNSDICDGGAVYWEDWDAVTHTNWIYVRHA